MIERMEHVAQLLFRGERLLSLSRLADVLMSRMLEDGESGIMLGENILTGQYVVCDAYLAGLDMAFVDGETQIALGISGHPGAEDEVSQARLARLCYALASDTPVQAVIWPGTDIRLPSDQFVANLAPLLEENPSVQAYAPRPRGLRGLTSRLLRGS
jgi:hypothetical protein